MFWVQCEPCGNKAAYQSTRRFFCARRWHAAAAVSSLMLDMLRAKKPVGDRRSGLEAKGDEAEV